MTPPLLLWPREAARILGVSTETLKAWAAAGKLTEIRQGWWRRYDPAEVRQLRAGMEAARPTTTPLPAGTRLSSPPEGAATAPARGDHGG